MTCTWQFVAGLGQAGMGRLVSWFETVGGPPETVDRPSGAIPFFVLTGWLALNRATLTPSDLYKTSLTYPSSLPLFPLKLCSFLGTVLSSDGRFGPWGTFYFHRHACSSLLPCFCMWGSRTFFFSRACASAFSRFLCLFLLSSRMHPRLSSRTFPSLPFHPLFL